MILSDPSHRVMVGSSYINERNLRCSLVLWGSKVIEDLVGPKNLGYLQPFLHTTVVVETTLSDEIAFHVNWVFTKVLLVLYFVGCQIA